MNKQLVVWLSCPHCGNASVMHRNMPRELVECRYCVNRVVRCDGFSLRVRDLWTPWDTRIPL